MARMRVALVNRLAGIHRGGGEIYDLNLAEALGRAGAEIRILTGRPLLGGALPDSPGVPVEHVRTPYMRGLAHRMGRAGWRVQDGDLKLFGRALRRRLASLAPRPDLVQVTGIPDLALRIEKDLGLPVLLLFPGPPALRHRETIRALRWVAGVGAVTPYLRREFGREVEDVTAGIDPDRFRPGLPSLRERLGIPADPPVILFAGRLVPLKNLPQLIRIFATVRKGIPETILLVAGEGPLLSEIRAAAARERIPLLKPGDAGRAGGGLLLAGEIPHEEMPACYAAADILLLTSENESFSLVALEAMACGVGVIAPSVGYLPHLVEEGVGGHLYPPGDDETGARLVASLLRDREALRALGEGGRRLAMGRHSWDSVAAQFLDIYRRMLAS